MPSSSTAMAIFWALLLLLTNILPGLLVDAHGCRQIQVTQWTSRSIKELRDSHIAGREGLSDYDLCLQQSLVIDAGKALSDKFTGLAAQNADQCLNLNCGRCTPAVLSVGTHTRDDVENPVFANKRCWIPTSAIELPRVHKLDDVKFFQNGQTQDCGFDNVVSRFKKVYQAVMIDDLSANSAKLSKTVFTIRLRKNPSSTKDIYDDVKCS